MPASVGDEWNRDAVFLEKRDLLLLRGLLLCASVAPVWCSLMVEW